MAWGKTKGLRISGTLCLPYQHAGTLVLNSQLTSASLLLAGREMMGWNRAAAPQGLWTEGTLTAHYSQLLVQTSGGKSCWTSNLYCGQNDSLAIPRKPQNPTATFPRIFVSPAKGTTVNQSQYSKSQQSKFWAPCLYQSIYQHFLSYSAALTVFHRKRERFGFSN